MTTDDELRADAKDSLLSGGEVVSKGRSRNANSLSSLVWKRLKRRFQHLFTSSD